MNKFGFALLASATVFAASPAAAQQVVNGTINVTGTVGGRCSVIDGSTEKATFDGTLALGRLDADNGTLRADLTTATSASPAAGQKVTARVVCTSANPTIGITADKLTNGETAAAETGYANKIDYVAAIRVVTTASATPVEYTFDTLAHAANSIQGGKLGSRIAGGTANNVEVNVSNLRTQGSAANVLNQGNYSSQIKVSIAPTI